MVEGSPWARPDRTVINEATAAVGFANQHIPDAQIAVIEPGPFKGGKLGEDITKNRPRIERGMGAHFIQQQFTGKGLADQPELAFVPAVQEQSGASKSAGGLSRKVISPDARVH